MDKLLMTCVKNNRMNWDTQRLGRALFHMLGEEYRKLNKKPITFCAYTLLIAPQYKTVRNGERDRQCIAFYHVRKCFASCKPNIFGTAKPTMIEASQANHDRSCVLY